MFDAAAFANRRERFMAAIGPDATAVFHSPPESLRNGDVVYPFRQSSDLYYLTGFAEPETTLILRPGSDGPRVIMFVRPRDPERETWDGRRAGMEGACASYGADVAYPASDLPGKLAGLLGHCSDLYYSFGHDAQFDQTITRLIAELRGAERRGLRPPRQVVDPREVLHEMRLRKTPDELERLRRAAAITVEAHRAAMTAAAPGRYEYEIQALVDYHFRKGGGTGPGYPSIVGGGINSTILHYTENNQLLRDGDLLLIDAGCEYDFYTADVTRTLPINGRFSPAQKRCYELVLAAQEEGIASARPGATINLIHDRCVEVLTQGMVDLGLLPGPAADRIADQTYRKFYMHRTSHWLGMDVHDVGAYNRDGKARPLEPGMVLTIEPGLYIASDAAEVPAEYRGIGIRIEDDILITDTGCEILTAAAPKAVAEVERACAGPGGEVAKR
jgi:Xaa-Pro aminopeptidase